jgi:hypothetical protein
MSNYKDQVKSFGCKGSSYINPNDKYIVIDLDDYIRNQSLLMGRLLTIIDASISDQTQRKALKDIIKQMSYETDNSLWCTYITKDEASEIGILGGGAPLPNESING